MRRWIYSILGLLLIMVACDRKWSNIYDPGSDISHEWAPKNLQIAQTATDEIKLSWENQDERIDGFILDRCVGASQSWEENYRLIDRDIRNISEAVDLGIYIRYRLQAFADEAISSSNEDTITTAFPAPAMLQWTTISESAVEFSWDMHPYADVTGYQIERKTGAGEFVVMDSIAEEAYRDTTLLTSEQYTFRFKAVAGNLLSEATPEKSLRWQTGDYSLAWEGTNANGVQDILFNESGDLMAVIGGWTFNIYNTYTGELLWTGSHNSGTNGVTFYKDQWIISVGWDGIKRWDLKTGELLETNPSYTNYRRINFSPDYLKMVTSAYSQGLVLCLDPGNLTNVIWQNDGDRWINSMDLSPDGSFLIIVTTGGDVEFINTIDGSIIHQILDQGFGWDSKFSPDGSKYALLGTSRIAIFNSNDHSLIWDEIDYQNIKREITFSHDGSKIVYSRGDTLKVAESSTGHQIWKTVWGSSSEINEMDISPDDQKLLTIQRNYGLRLWDLNTGSELWSDTFSEYSDACAFSPDNNRFACGDMDGALKVWIEKIWLDINGE